VTELLIAAAWLPAIGFALAQRRIYRQQLEEWTDWAVCVEVRQDDLETRLDVVDVTLMDQSL
jgi:hypothetical protein